MNIKTTYDASSYNFLSTFSNPELAPIGIASVIITAHWAATHTLLQSIADSGLPKKRTESQRANIVLDLEVRIINSTARTLAIHGQFQSASRYLDAESARLAKEHSQFKKTNADPFWRTRSLIWHIRYFYACSGPWNGSGDRLFDSLVDDFNDELNRALALLIDGVSKQIKEWRQANGIAWIGPDNQATPFDASHDWIHHWILKLKFLFLDKHVIKSTFWSGWRQANDDQDIPAAWTRDPLLLLDTCFVAYNFDRIETPSLELTTEVEIFISETWRCVFPDLTEHLSSNRERPTEAVDEYYAALQEDFMENRPESIPITIESSDFVARTSHQDQSRTFVVDAETNQVVSFYNYLMNWDTQAALDGVNREDPGATRQALSKLITTRRSMLPGWDSLLMETHADLYRSMYSLSGNNLVALNNFEKFVSQLDPRWKVYSGPIGRFESRLVAGTSIDRKTRNERLANGTANGDSSVERRTQPQIEQEILKIIRTFDRRWSETEKQLMEKIRSPAPLDTIETLAFLQRVPENLTGPDLSQIQKATSAAPSPPDPIRQEQISMAILQELQAMRQRLERNEAVLDNILEVQESIDEVQRRKFFA